MILRESKASWAIATGTCSIVSAYYIKTQERVKLENAGEEVAEVASGRW